MSLSEISTTIDKELVTNYSIPLNVDISASNFDSTGKDEWISGRFNASLAVTGAFDGTAQGRERIEGIYSVRCYGMYRITSQQTADEVKTILKNQQLDFSVYVGDCRIDPVQDLENDLYVTTLHFFVTQF